MIYKVTAKFKKDKAEDFYRILTDGTVKSIEPDGRDIIRGMDRAVLQDNGEVLWSELCYCPTPLKHEREVVFDEYFENFKTEVIDNLEDYEGPSFMKYLENTIKK